jgi:hypothetical protein
VQERLGHAGMVPTCLARGSLSNGDGALTRVGVEKVAARTLARVAHDGLKYKWCDRFNEMRGCGGRVGGLVEGGFGWMVRGVQRTVAVVGRVERFDSLEVMLAAARAWGWSGVVE